MVAVKAKDIKYNFREICARIIGGEALIVSRPNNENIVMISEKEYAELEKMRKNNEYITMLNKSFDEAKRGEVITKSMAELRAMEFLTLWQTEPDI